MKSQRPHCPYRVSYQRVSRRPGINSLRYQRPRPVTVKITLTPVTPEPPVVRDIHPGSLARSCAVTRAGEVARRTLQHVVVLHAVVGSSQSTYMSRMVLREAFSAVTRRPIVGPALPSWSQSTVLAARQSSTYGMAYRVPTTSASSAASTVATKFDAMSESHGTTARTNCEHMRHPSCARLPIGRGVAPKGYEPAVFAAFRL